ncbi:Os07g0183650 [Oryza sativa Japonica Group]|uniref:Os07g0183650 protein n=1 Tax=Oryza sativa subsp. japonica TaxID=39947 RepID=A0A0P0X352_ORYSJ|nr:Os07g0183650 [Oryza sativa Japonica Group]
MSLPSSLTHVAGTASVTLLLLHATASLCNRAACFSSMPPRSRAVDAAYCYSAPVHLRLPVRHTIIVVRPPHPSTVPTPARRCSASSSSSHCITPHRLFLGRCHADAGAAGPRSGDRAPEVSGAEEEGMKRCPISFPMTHPLASTPDTSTQLLLLPDDHLHGTTATFVTSS